MATLTPQRLNIRLHIIIMKKMLQQIGAVGEAFAKHEKEKAAGKWREALKEAADLAGWEVKKTADGHEAKLIKRIVEEISLDSYIVSDVLRRAPCENLSAINYCGGRQEPKFTADEHNGCSRLQYMIEAKKGLRETTLVHRRFAEDEGEFDYRVRIDFKSGLRNQGNKSNKMVNRDEGNDNVVEENDQAAEEKVDDEGDNNEEESNVGLQKQHKNNVN
ncbi:hypothetical protein L1887_39324 [Cichorium endivia]|nr:hypothetical protein L1887_39324 [Cichorium endivia]